MIKEILKTNDHRPWDLPLKKWKYYQEWNDVIFLHWKVDTHQLRKLVPNELEIDLFEGDAWVSLVAFTMERIRPRNLPSFPPISNFHEINIRTYVKSNSKSGVYFLSIEGGTQSSCLIAKKLSQLPYRYSKMNRQKDQYASENNIYNDKLDLAYTIGEKLNTKTPLEMWLTERYALFQDTKDTINEFDIHHIEWPIHKIEFEELNVDYPRFDKLLNNTPHLCQYSPGVKVVAWDKQKIL